MSVANPVRRFDAARWVHRLLVVRAVALGLWALVFLILSWAATGGLSARVLVPILVAWGAAKLARAWRREAGWVGPVLVLVEIGTLFLCAFTWLRIGPTGGILLFGGISTAVLVLLSVRAARDRRADPHRW